MKMIERMIVKVVVFHFILLMIVQSVFQSTSLIKNMNKIHLYEGVGGKKEVEKIEVTDE